MLALIRFLFLCALAIASGVAAVSIPVGGRTAAEHVRHYVHAVVGAVEAAAPSTSPPPAAAPAARARPAAKRAEERPPADSIRDEERAALDHLIGEKSH